jgi:hypothetical protein
MFQWLLVLEERSAVDKTSFNFFIIGFSVGTESLNHDAYSTFVPIFASTCAKIFILSLIVS